ncbi:MAG: RHS domain-containing protein, partial [Bacteroides sp.]
MSCSCFSSTVTTCSSSSLSSGSLELVNNPSNFLGHFTWVFEEESFVPMALLLNGKVYSIVTDQLGTPTEAYNAEGEEVWHRRLDMNGKILEEEYNRNAPY